MPGRTKGDNERRDTIMALPKENFDNKNFGELVKDALTRLPIYAEEWTDHNIHDPGITFIELFAWLTEMQLYRLNRISEKTYRKFLKLLGIPGLDPPKPARVDLCFSLQQTFPNDFLEIPVETVCYSKDPLTGENIAFKTRENINAVKAELVKILSHPSHSIDEDGKFIDNTEANKKENVYFHAFGSGNSEPQEGDKLYVGFCRIPTNIKISLALFLKNGTLLPTVEEDSFECFTPVKLLWEYYSGEDDDDNNWTLIEKIDDNTNNLMNNGRIQITVQGVMGKTTINNAGPYYWLRCRIEVAGYNFPPIINSLQLNTLSAIQASARITETFSGNDLPDLYIDLKKPPVPGNTLIVLVDEVPWEQVEDFDASKPYDNCFMVNPVIGRISFGNGINGRIPPKGENNIIVFYCTGGGIRGNVQPYTINGVTGDLAQYVTVTNPKPAAGGCDAQTLEQAIYCARKNLKEVTRAVTSSDYEYLALHTPGLKVARARALEGYHPVQKNKIPGIVTVIVIPENNYSKPKPGTGFLKTVLQHLEKHRLLTTELFVFGPEYLEVSVTATVVIKPTYVIEHVEERVKETLRDFLHPIHGWMDESGWPFGRSVYISEIYQVIDNVEGVDYVTDVSLKGVDNNTGDVLNEGPFTIDIPPHFLVCSGEHTITGKE